jgi:8-oxo-dGTP pyrophosphatase MutT (NUDIX family)
VTEVSEPRQAASVVLLRESEAGPEVLLVERSASQRTMGGAWVFPGGALGPEDADHAAAARRELEEEAGIALTDGADLVPWTRWITPAEVAVRFDATFFLAEAPPGATPRPDGTECTDARWLRATDALAAHERGELSLVFPTIKHLEALSAFPSVAAALDAARDGEVVPVQPQVVSDGERRAIVLPGEPGYDP